MKTPIKTFIAIVLIAGCCFCITSCLNPKDILTPMLVGTWTGQQMVKVYSDGKGHVISIDTPSLSNYFLTFTNDGRFAITPGATLRAGTFTARNSVVYFHDTISHLDTVWNIGVIRSNELSFYSFTVKGYMADTTINYTYTYSR